MRPLAIAILMLAPTCAYGGQSASESLKGLLKKDGFVDTALKMRPVNQLVFGATVNGKEGNLVASTASDGGIERNRAAKFGVTKGSSQGGGIGKVTKLVIGGCLLANVPVRILDFGSNPWRPAVDGLFGTWQMRRSGAVIDCGAQTLYVNEKGPNEVTSARLERFLTDKGYVSVPMRWTSADRFLVHCTLNGNACTMLVDLASPLSCVTVETAATAGMSYRTTSWGVKTTDASSPQRIGIGRAKELLIGGFKVVDPDIAIAKIDWNALGAEYLLLNAAVLDTGGMNLYLRHSRKRR